jgi:Na+/serine symporter
VLNTKEWLGLTLDDHKTFFAGDKALKPMEIKILVVSSKVKKNTNKRISIRKIVVLLFL